jgi:hypothetical protein
MSVTSSISVPSTRDAETNGSTGSLTSLANGTAHSVNGTTVKYKYARDKYMGQERPIRIIVVGAGLSGIAAVIEVKGGDLAFYLTEPGTENQKALPSSEMLVNHH